MKSPEKIYAIPIVDAFDRPEGCPLCALRAKLEDDSVAYILGAAMMEPDVRVRVNESGFCARHLDAMTKRGNRLSLALMLESILGRLLDQGEPAMRSHHCFVCGRVDGFMGHFRENIVLMWRTEPAFAEKLAARPLCLPHASALLNTAGRLLGRRAYESFRGAVANTVNRRAGELHRDISAFCRSFDHRMAGQAFNEEIKTAVERTAAFLGGEHPPLSKRDVSQ